MIFCLFVCLFWEVGGGGKELDMMSYVCVSPSTSSL